jgi:thiol:disulfide interchange protein DsbD
MENLFIQLQTYLNETSLLAYLVVFLGGILVSFTPCVYPLIPITVGYIGSHSQRSKLRGFILSLFYVLGVAIIYSALGAFASLTGKLFGEVGSSPISYFIVANVCILLGLSLLEVFNLRLPAFLSNLQPKRRTEGLLGAFSLGLVSGLIVGPCTALVLGALLVYVGTKQNVLFGMTLLFTFAYGMGALLNFSGHICGSSV